MGSPSSCTSTPGLRGQLACCWICWMEPMQCRLKSFNSAFWALTDSLSTCEGSCQGGVRCNGRVFEVDESPDKLEKLGRLAQTWRDSSRARIPPQVASSSAFWWYFAWFACCCNSDNHCASAVLPFWKHGNPTKRHRSRVLLSLSTAFPWSYPTSPMKWSDFLIRNQITKC